MRIGVVLDQKLSGGGGFQQALSTLLLIDRYKRLPYRFCFFTTECDNVEILRRVNIRCALIVLPQLDAWSAVWQKYFREKNEITKQCPTPLDLYFQDAGIHLVYFLGPSLLALQLKFTHFILTVWDQCHRDFMEFPEVYDAGEFDARERLYWGSLPKAVGILVDSALNKYNLVRRYGIDQERVHVAPFVPAADFEDISHDTLPDIRSRYGIQGDFIFYPAQFWAHKNHVYILKTLQILRHKGVIINAVFVGNDFGNLDYILKMSEKLKVREQLIYPGFVEQEEIIAFYKSALALVMPTYFGPTNLPPLEAFALECPVCYSNLPGLREQVEDAAFLLDPGNPESLVEILLRILHGDPALEIKKRLGREIVSRHTAYDYWVILESILENFRAKMGCWINV